MQQLCRHGHIADNGCSGEHRCHAPHNSGSVISYDHLEGGSLRYNVTEEDISHIPDATWNPNTRDRFTVSRPGDPFSGIKAWGVWIDHEFEVSGKTALGKMWGGDFDLDDVIYSAGWIKGTPSNAPTGSATYSGTDNFLGVDMSPDRYVKGLGRPYNFLGALLRADAELTYLTSPLETG